ncbi:hypothetical protein PIB30_029192 [Stylosanthes scabra]|uniref:Replication protein A 70 kDa DNA-binding subunit B/D first OB fold domain-containing protein n=1 Tax=Stylosanthes scabra TaxID=79078 RepID=A0ABU6QBB9_9FABA|nr:hypothetical protein [Stylosanthes scabra]
MAERFDLLSHIHPRKMHWCIQVYVIRMYEVPSYDDPSVINSIDMILQDSQGGRIHSSIPKKLMDTWRPIIKEFHMYNMRNFMVMDKRPKVRATQIRRTLSFCNRTEVQEVDLLAFPLEPFTFRTISDILNPAVVTETELFDIVAEVVGKEDAREFTTSKGLDTKRMGRITCVDKITPLMTEDRVEPLIVVLQFFRVNQWDGKTSIQSHFDISKVCFDASLKDIVEFRNSQSSGPGIEQLRRGQAEPKTIEDAWNTT